MKPAREKDGRFKTTDEIRDRDHQLCQDYLFNKERGIPMVWLVSKYKISTQRIYDILDKYGIQR